MPVGEEPGLVKWKNTKGGLSEQFTEQNIPSREELFCLKVVV